MKIVIHGTNGGYHIFTTEKEKLFDARPDSNKVGSIGQEAYSINYSDNSIVFSKYKIIRDVVGDKRTGNVAFSIVIPHTKKLSGMDVLAILDRLSNNFCSKHILNDNLDNFREDWVWVSEIKSEYEGKFKFNDEQIVGGSADPAFLYFSRNELLEKYFDLPYQEEYSAYKQIFFVEKSLEGKPENPLNALRHDQSANLTGKIDLENPKYKLIYNQQAKGGVKIEVKVSDSLRYSKSKIKRKEELEIIWSKKFCERKVKSGKWFEIGSEFLEINDSEKTITVKEIELNPITYDLVIQTKDRFYNPITDAEITLKFSNYLPERKVINNSIQITEEELQSKCYIIAKNENLISPQREIKLEDTKGIISLLLSEHKKVRFEVSDNNGFVYYYNIQISNKEIQPKDGDVVFIEEEINENWLISVSHRDYETERFYFCPAKDESPKYVKLKKRSNSNTGQNANEKKQYLKVDVIKGKRSWYQKVPKLAWIIFIIAIVTATVFLLIKSDDTNGNTNLVDIEISTKLNSYVEGIELKLDTLKEYKRKYCESTTIIQSDLKEKRLWQKIWIFDSNEESNSINESSALPDFCLKIDNAIKIREAINLGKIDQLHGREFSEAQQNFKNSIDSIDDKFNKQICDTLNARKVSVLDLNKVAILIQNTQSDLRAKEGLIDTENRLEKDANQDKQNDQRKKEQQKNNNNNQQNSQTQLPPSSGNSLEKEFWDLVHSGNDQMESYKKLLKKHKSKGGDIIAYLNKICKNSTTFKKFKDIDEIDRKNADTFTKIDIE